MTANNGPLESLSALVGDWAYEMTHQALPGVLRGTSTFELLEGGKFLIQREDVDHPEFSGSSLAVIGGEDNLLMHYFDSRGVVRILELSIDGRVWTFVRDKSDLSPLDFLGTRWEDDIHITYRRT